MKLLSELREDLQKLPCHFCGAAFEPKEDRVLSFYKGEWIMFHRSYSSLKADESAHDVRRSLGPLWENLVV